jgi:hypothetical protein
MTQRYALFLLLLCLPAMLAAKGSRGPYITRDRARAPIIVLSPAMQMAIRQYAASFTPCAFDHFTPSLRAHYRLTSRQIPTAVIGDFNGDRKPDVALQGHTKACFGVIVLLSRGREYRVVEYQMIEQENPRAAWVGMGDEKKEYGHLNNLLYAPPGRFNSPFEDHPVRIRHDAFFADSYEKATALVYYAGGRFHEYATAD